MAKSTIKKQTVNCWREIVRLTIGSSYTDANLQIYDNIRILNLNGILNIPAANTIYSTATISSIHSPTVSANASFTPIVSGQVKGIGRFSVLSDGRVQIISNFAGTQEIGATLLWAIFKS